VCVARTGNEVWIEAGDVVETILADGVVDPADNPPQADRSPVNTRASNENGSFIL